MVEGCEDYRKLKDVSDAARLHHWLSVQSFVLDQKVNDVLSKRGFDLSIFKTHSDEGLTYYSCALMTGYRPQYAREAAFFAMTLAAATLDRDQANTNMSALDPLSMATSVFQSTIPEVHQLACQLAAVVRRHGCADRAGITRTIDEWARLTFEFAGDPLDLDKDLDERRPPEPYIDKYPDAFPDLRVVNKLEIARVMAKMNIRAGARCRISYTHIGTARAEFELESGEWSQPIVLTTLQVLPEPITHVVPPITAPMSNRLLHEFFHGARAQSPQPRQFFPPDRPVQSPTQRPGLPTPFGPMTILSQSLFRRMAYFDASALGPEFLSVTPPRGPVSRQYSPGIARFVGAMRLAQQLAGQNPYIYAQNNPVNKIEGQHNEPAFPCTIRLVCFRIDFKFKHCGVKLTGCGFNEELHGGRGSSPFGSLGGTCEILKYPAGYAEDERSGWGAKEWYASCEVCRCIHDAAINFNSHLDKLFYDPVPGNCCSSPCYQCNSNYAAKCILNKCFKDPIPDFNWGNFGGEPVGWSHRIRFCVKQRWVAGAMCSAKGGGATPGERHYCECDQWSETKDDEWCGPNR